MSEREEKPLVKRQTREHLLVLRIYLRMDAVLVRFDGAAVSLSAMELA